MSKTIFKNICNRIYCALCDREITGRTYTCCQECNGLTSCIVCFSQGIENSTHKSSHPYSVMSRINLPLYHPNWTIQDEYLLIESLEKYGYGNWAEITKQVGKKIEEDVEEHFLTYYLNKAEDTENNAVETINGYNGHESSQSHENLMIIEKEDDHFIKLSNRVLAKLEPCLETAMEKSEKYGINLTDKTGYGQVIGFMPLRKEFEVEYNNDAELYIADMEFSPDDSEMEYKTKLCVLEIYYSRLQERDQKKKFVIEHDLIDINEVFKREKNMSEDERQIRYATRDKMPFLSKEEYEELVQCYLKEIEFSKFENDLQTLEKYKIETLKNFEDMIFDDSIRVHKKAELENAVKRIKQEEVEIANSKKRNKLKVNSTLEKHSVVERNNANNTDLTGLLKNELDLCNLHQIEFDFYLLVKEYLIRECYFKGSIQKKEMLKICNYNSSQFEIVFDFLVKQKLLVLEEDC